MCHVQKGVNVCCAAIQTVKTLTLITLFLHMADWRANLVMGAILPTEEEVKAFQREQDEAYARAHERAPPSVHMPVPAAWFAGAEDMSVFDAQVRAAHVAPANTGAYHQWHYVVDSELLRLVNHWHATRQCQHVSLSDIYYDTKDRVLTMDKTRLRLRHISDHSERKVRHDIAIGEFSLRLPAKGASPFVPGRRSRVAPSYPGTRTMVALLKMVVFTPIIADHRALKSSTSCAF